jgi:hypothetical protein
MAENPGQIPNYDFNQNPGFVPPNPQPQDPYNQNTVQMIITNLSNFNLR